MEPKEMGKTVVHAVVENIKDALDAADGTLPPEKVRKIEVNDALADTGATMLLLPSRFIAHLGLKPYRPRHARGVGGTVSMSLYSAVRLSIQGRECTTDVGEISDDLPVVIGQIPLEMMDWVVDPRGQKHGGEQIIEVL